LEKKIEERDLAIQTMKQRENDDEMARKQLKESESASDVCAIHHLIITHVFPSSPASQPTDGIHLSFHVKIWTTGTGNSV
jgi:hypothetical protein